MLTIYHLAVSQSDRVVWLAEELDIPYELQWFERGPDFLMQDDYRALHPTATAPTIRDGECVLAESVAIVEYLSHRYGGGRLSVPPAAGNYPDYLYWMQLNNTLQSIFLAKMAAGDNADPENPLIKTLHSREQRYYRHLNNRLASCNYLAGDTFSCADIMAMFPLTMLPQMSGVDLSVFSAVQAYIERIAARPAYKKAMAIAGPDAQKPEAL